MPDLIGLRDAYARTALFRTLNDADLHTAIGEVMGDPEFDPIGALWDLYMTAVDEEGVPDVLALLDPLREISLSVHVSEGRVDTLIREIQALEERGGDPGPYLLANVGVQLQLTYIDEEEAQRGLRFLTELAAEEGANLIVDERDGISVLRDGGDDPIEQAYRLVQDGARMTLLVGAAADEAAYMARAGGQAPVLERAQMLSAGMQHFTGEGTTIVEGYSAIGEQLFALPELAEVAPLVELLEGVVGTPVSMIARGGHWRVLVDDQGRFVTEGFHGRMDDIPLSGVFGGAPLEKGALSLIHPDAIVGWATHFDDGPLRELIESKLGTLEEDPFVQIDEAFGFRPDRDLLEPLGPALAYSLPAPKSLLSAPPLMLSAALEEGGREAFLRGMDGLAALVEHESGGQYEFRVSEYRGMRLYELDFEIPGLADIGLPIDPSALLKPTVAVLEDRVFVTTLPSHAKREIRRVLKQDPTLNPLLVGSCPEGSTQVAFADWIQFIGKLYGGAKAMAPMIAATAGEELPFDLGKLPDAEVVTRHFAPTQRWTRHVEGGVLHYEISSFGPEIPMVLSIAAVGGLFVARQELLQADMAHAPEEVFVEIPEGASVQWHETFGELQHLKAGATVYRHEMGSWPAELADLARPFGGFPQGFFDGGPIPQDAWGNTIRYGVAEDGKSIMLWSMGPDGWDDGGGGDDIVVE